MPYHPSVQMGISEYFPIMGRIDTGLHYPIVLPIAFIEQLPEEEQAKLIPCKGYFAKWPLWIPMRTTSISAMRSRSGT